MAAFRVFNSLQDDKILALAKFKEFAYNIPDDKILAVAKLEAFADDKMNVTQNMIGEVIRPLQQW